MKFVGAIAFLDSVERLNDGRHTNVMKFNLCAEWFKSVQEFYRQMVLAGQYDGSEVLITIYEYDGSYDELEFPADWHYDSNWIESTSIKNPYYV